MNNLDLTIRQLRGRYITLDCNVLILLVIGSIGKIHIGKFKRTNIFQDKDYDLLIKLLSKSNIILTPNVVSEASNLLESYSIKGQKVGLLGLKSIIEIVGETYNKSNELTKLGSYLKFGLSDSSIDVLCQNNVIPITVDFPLYGYLVSKSYPVINFNHIRTEYTIQ